jgi:predicted PurR-regulated permease PerM
MAGKKSTLITLVALTAVASGFVLVLIQPFTRPLFAALVLGLTVLPIHRALLRKWKRPVLCAVMTTLLLVAVVITPLTMLVATIAGEGRQIYLRLAEESAGSGGWSSWLANLIEPPVEWIARQTGIQVPNLRSIALQRAQALSSNLVEAGGSLVGNLTSTLGDAILTLFLTMFLLLEGDDIRAGIIAWLPLAREQTEKLLNSISDAIIANVYGIAAVGVCQGVLTGLGFWMTGLGSPFLWGSTAAICSLIPIVGTAIIWVPGVVILFAHGTWIKAVFLLFWCVVVVGMSDNVIRPWVLSGRTEMNTLVVFFSVMGGLQAFGFLGLFAGPVTFSMAIALFRMLRDELRGAPA